LTAAADTNIAIAATQITSGTIDSARLSGTYSGITGVGTLTNLTVSNPITGSITGNAGTATTATTATSATTATNIAGGAAASIPVQTGAGVHFFSCCWHKWPGLNHCRRCSELRNPDNGNRDQRYRHRNGLRHLPLGDGDQQRQLTLGGTLDLSAPPTIGNTTPNTGRFTTLTVDDNTTLGSSNADTVDFVARVSSEFSPATDDTFDLGRTGHEWRDLFIDGTANIDSLVADTADINAGTIDNTTIGTTTAAAAKVTTLDVTSTLALNGDTGVSGYVLTSNGASAPTWQANANGLTIVDDTTTNSSFYLTFTSASTGNITTANVSSTKLSFNPSTGVLTLGAALPVASGGTGATTSTGSGAVVLATSPSLVTPVLGTPSSGTLSSCTVDGTDAVGFRNTPVNSQSAAYTLVLADSGKTIFHPVADDNARTFTIPANSSVAYPVGTVLSFVNLQNTVTIAITTDTMYLANDGERETEPLRSTAWPRR
jgi:hypothetical protein